MKDYVCFAIGAIGSMIASLFGGWDASLQTLVIFMAIDYITGLIVAGVFHASPKTETGTLESRAGWKGLIRKGETLLIVLVACRLDAVMGSNFVRDAAVIAFVANETISIIENAGLMGLPIPEVIIKAVDILKQKAESSTEQKGSNYVKASHLYRNDRPHRCPAAGTDQSGVERSGQARAAYRERHRGAVGHGGHYPRGRVDLVVEE